LRKYSFILVLLIAILLAYLFPSGLDSLPLKSLTNVGIGLIFFFYGLKLAPWELKAGILNYRSHLLIQFGTFIFFPLLTFLFLPFFEEGVRSNLWLAIFFLGVLPSTVSSSVVMVALAKGNLPTAIFNASISGIIGIIATPLWLSFFLLKTGNFAIVDIISKLLLQILLPLIIGILLQRYLGDLARINSKWLGKFDKAVIALIVYSSFSNSFKSNLFDEIPLADIFKVLVIIIILFFLIYKGLGLLSKLFGMSVEDKITTKFCGTKKSLVHGSVMAKIIFGSSSLLGLMLLPIMLYHIFQLIVVSFVAEKYRRRIEK
jgi:solute carrier family 10 (sodium/bile acid cotransporter), member 7